MKKNEILKVFNENYKEQGLRLLAVQLNGFSHKLFFDRGSWTDSIEVAEYSGCVSSAERSTFRNHTIAEAVLSNIPHYCYQGAPEELIYIAPDER